MAALKKPRLRNQLRPRSRRAILIMRSRYRGGSEPCQTYSQWAKPVLSSQPFSLLLGAELIKFSPEGTELRLPVSEQLKQQFGFIHGGVLAYVADNAMTFARALSLGAATAVATSEMKINYIRPTGSR